jgi:hypothetical protein
MRIIQLSPCVIALLCALAEGYITSPPGVLPPLKQKAWLDSMTGDILKTPTGDLTSADILETIPRIMSAWSSHPIVMPGNSRRRIRSKKQKCKTSVASALLPSRVKTFESPLASDMGPTGIECATTTEKLLKRLIDESYATASDDSASPILTVDVYNSVLASWVRVCEPSVTEDVGIAIAAATRATTILIQMQELYEQNPVTNRQIQPDETSFRIALSAWVSTAELALSHEDGPSSEAFHAISHAQSVLEWMTDLYIGEHTPDNMLLARNEHVKDVVLDRQIYHIIMSLWSACTSAEEMGGENITKALEACEKLLFRMEQLAQQKFYLEPQNMEDSVRPDTATYNFVLQAWSKAVVPDEVKSKNSLTTELVARHCEGIRQHMERLTHVEPNNVTYRSLLHAYAKHGTKDCVLKSMQLLKKSAEKYNRAVMEEGRSTKEAAAEFLPDTLCYNRVIDALAKTKGLPDAHHRAKQVLDSMQRMPDIFTYSSAISACAFATGSPKLKRKAFYMAMDLWETLNAHPEFGEANHVTYGTLLRACTYLLPHGDERDKHVLKILEACKQNGCMNDRIAKQAKTAASKTLYKELKKLVELRP